MGCVSVEKNLRVTHEGFACYTQHAFNLRLVCTLLIVAAITGHQACHQV